MTIITNFRALQPGVSGERLIHPCRVALALFVFSYLDQNWLRFAIVRELRRVLRYRNLMVRQATRMKNNDTKRPLVQRRSTGGKGTVGLV